MKTLSLILVLFLITGCDYQNTNTTTTNVSATETGALDVQYVKDRNESIVIGGETYSASTKIGLDSNGTKEGTSTIFDMDFSFPSIERTISIAVDGAKEYTLDELYAIQESIVNTILELFGYTRADFENMFNDTNTTTS